MLGKKGVTFVELLVSTILVGIVMLGVVSFSMTIKNLQESSNTFGNTSMELMAAVRLLSRDIMLAVGDESDRGIVTYQNGTKQNICFRLDKNIPVTPGDYSDDTWNCYYHGNSYGIHYLENVPANVVPCTSWASCNNGADSSTTILVVSQNEYFNVVEDSDGRLNYVELTVYSGNQNITTRVNPINHGR